MSNVKLIEFLPFESLSFFDKLVLTLLFTIALDKLEISVDQYKKNTSYRDSIRDTKCCCSKRNLQLS